jgi:hypothetical protein
MSIDSSFIDNQRLHLAVGCQDGTIRIFVVKKMNDDALQVQSSHTVMVDGPIVALSMDSNNNNLYAGSMCGFVCRLQYNNNEHSWSGPTMVTPDPLQDAKLSTEDCVLAVHSLNNRVVVGTQSGQCCLYEQCEGDYYLAWHCQLPYPIHGVVLLQRSSLLVLTRRTVHVFHEQSQQKYSASKAKQRLIELLNERRGGSVETPSSEATSPL